MRCAAGVVRLRRCFSTSAGTTREPLVLTCDKNRVRTLTMNNPQKLNGWTEPMLLALKRALEDAASDPSVSVIVLTGTGKYYSAGVNLAGTMQLMHPQSLHDFIYKQNRAVFDAFLDVPKPIIAAVNGAAIGACVTTASTCDALLLAEGATLSTPFARLGVRFG